MLRSTSVPAAAAPTSNRREVVRDSRKCANASRSCGTRFDAFTFPNAPKTGSPDGRSGATSFTGHAGSASKPLDDPAMGFRVIADVVEREISSGVLATPCDFDVKSLLEKRQQERRVIRNPRTLWGHRAEVGDSHGRATIG